MFPDEALALEIMRAHQGGWDEILAVAGPGVVVATLIFVARKRRPPEDDTLDDQ